MKLDIYKGWSEDALKRRCLHFVRSIARKDVIIAVLARYGVDELSADDRKEVERICAQWDD